jgi:hypothetical protein
MEGPNRLDTALLEQIRQRLVEIVGWCLVLGILLTVLNYYACSILSAVRTLGGKP